MAPVTLRLVAPALLSLVLAGCGGGGCVYDDAAKATEALKPINEAIAKCLTDNVADAVKLKKCQCDAQDSLIKFYQAAADDCSGAVQDAAKANVELTKGVKTALGCAASIV